MTNSLNALLYDDESQRDRFTIGKPIASHKSSTSSISSFFRCSLHIDKSKPKAEHRARRSSGRRAGRQEQACLRLHIDWSFPFSLSVACLRLQKLSFRTRAPARHYPSLESEWASKTPTFGVFESEWISDLQVCLRVFEFKSRAILTTRGIDKSVNETNTRLQSKTLLAKSLHFHRLL